jgi:hypothetical protein
MPTGVPRFPVAGVGQSAVRTTRPNDSGSDARSDPTTTGGPEAARFVERETETAYAISGMIRMATMFATLIIGLIAGPAVSL